MPWVFCLLIFGYLFYQIPPKELLAALKLVHIFEFTFYVVLYFFIVHLFDCLTIKIFISRFSTLITHKESWIVRGVSYLIMILNYHAAQGAFAVYFKKTHQASIFKTLGTLAFISMMDFILVLSCALVTLSFSDVAYKGYDIKSYILGIAPTIYIGYLLWILFWKNVDKPYLDRIKNFKLINWVLKHNTFLIFREASYKDYLLLFICRAPMILVIIGGFKLGLMAFQVDIDLESLYLYNPIILFISTIPITPAGLGTGQILTIEFFQNVVTSPLFEKGIITPQSILLTSSLLWVIANQIIKAIFGAICLSTTSKALFISDTPDNT
ncbi:hypothetical protein BVY03_01815 [bacterium K02(2017)]|nr:hypothetical protein BVY03_01815 [bacterium K02(2017)]